MESIFLGITQGLTEFLPISSSGHLYVIKKILGINEEGYHSFIVFLHIATLLAILCFLFKNLKLFFNKRLFLNVCVITFITGILGISIKVYLQQFFDSRYLVAFCFIINAGILLGIKADSNQRVSSSIRLRDSFFIGVLQGISALPGISRSGITIAGLLKRGFAKEEAFVLSFLMAIPVILGAFILEFKELVNRPVSIQSLISGFIFAFIFGLVSLRIVKKTLIVDKFKSFAYYCLFISIISLIL